MRSLGLFCILLFTSAKAQQFVPDLQFGVQGINFHQGPTDVTNATPVELLLLPDGKFLLGSMIGYNGGLISRHLTNGDRDSSFATDGVLHLLPDPGQLLQMRALSVSVDGSITAFSMQQPTAGNGKTLLFEQFHSNGSPVLTFGDDGRAVQSVSDDTSIRTLVIQEDGSIIFAGSMEGALMLGRLTSDGQLDPSFGNNGIGLYPLPGLELSLARMRVAVNGDIFLVGSQEIGFDATGLAVCKVQTNGALDTSFGDNGFFLYDHSENIFLYESLTDLHTGVDGSLVVAGSIALDGIKERFCVLKLRPDGSLDQAFGSGGIVLHGTLPTDRNLLMDLAYDPRGFYVLFGSLMRNGQVTRSMYVFMDGSGMILPDASGVTDHIISGPDIPDLSRRMMLDAGGGFVEGLGFSFRPIGISALRRFVFSSPTGYSTLASAHSPLHTWPNPTTGTLRIDLTEPFKQQPTITMLDPLGRIVADQSTLHWSFTGDHSIALELPNTIAEGRYSLVMATGIERRMAHIVVQR